MDALNSKASTGHHRRYASRSGKGQHNHIYSGTIEVQSLHWLFTGQKNNIGRFTSIISPICVRDGGLWASATAIARFFPGKLLNIELHLRILLARLISNSSERYFSTSRGIFFFLCFGLVFFWPFDLKFLIGHRVAGIHLN